MQIFHDFVCIAADSDPRIVINNFEAFYFLEKNGIKLNFLVFLTIIKIIQVSIYFFIFGSEFIRNYWARSVARRCSVKKVFLEIY